LPDPIERRPLDGYGISRRCRKAGKGRRHSSRARLEAVGMRGAKFAQGSLEKTIDRLLGKVGGHARIRGGERGLCGESGQLNHRQKQDAQREDQEGNENLQERESALPPLSWSFQSPVPCSGRSYWVPVEGCSVTVTVKRAVDSPPAPSDTMTVNGTFPVVPGDVTQRTHPVPRSMLIPVGASFKEYVNRSPSGSDAWT